jgi:hypothetical protein
VSPSRMCHVSLSRSLIRSDDLDLPIRSDDWRDFVIMDLHFVALGVLVVWDSS